MTRTKVLACLAFAGLLAGCSDDDTAVPAPLPDSGADAVADAAHDAAVDGGAADSSVPDGSDGSVAQTPVQRGKYLVDTVIGCSDCHTPQGPQGPDMTKYLAGNPTFVATPGGNLGARNLTNDATGLKNRTDAEIKAMFLNGTRPTATGTEALNPIMPYYVLHNMTDDDANAIVAYLRTVPAVVNSIPQRATMFDVTAPANALDPAKIPQPQAGTADLASANRGRYLAAEAGLCIECHTKHQNQPDPLILTKLFQGGEDYSPVFAATLRITPVSKNITSDVTTGIGSWSTQEVLDAITKGKAKDGSGICPPMPTAAYGNLTAQDAQDIANYVKSIPPGVNAVADRCVFPPVAAPDGGTDASTDAGDGG